MITYQVLCQLQPENRFNDFTLITRCIQIYPPIYIKIVSMTLYKTGRNWLIFDILLK